MGQTRNTPQTWRGQAHGPEACGAGDARGVEGGARIDDGAPCVIDACDTVPHPIDAAGKRRFRLPSPLGVAGAWADGGAAPPRQVVAGSGRAPNCGSTPAQAAFRCRHDPAARLRGLRRGALHVGNEVRHRLAKLSRGAARSDGDQARLQAHLPAQRVPLRNNFRAKKQFSSGVIEGLNYKAKVTMRKAYGYRTLRIAELFPVSRARQAAPAKTRPQILLTKPKNPIRCALNRNACGRDARLKPLWSGQAAH